MNGANGRADPSAGSPTNAEYPPIDAGLGNTPRVQQYGSERIKALVAELEVPFDPSVIVWRVTNTAKGEKRGK